MPPNVSDSAMWERLGKMDAFLERYESDHLEAHENHEAMYRRLEEQSKHLVAVEHAVGDVRTDVAALKTTISEEIMPTVQDYKGLKIKAAGVVLALLFIGSIVSAAFTLLFDQIKAWLGIGGVS